MEVDRRSLIKGMVAGGVLLALGDACWAFAEQPRRRPSHCRLLLGGTSADELFVRGARVACRSKAYDDLQIVKLKGGLLVEMDRVVTLRSQSPSARWIAVMDDAGAVIFLEWARTAGVRLLSMGTHAYSTDAACRLRHVWASASPVQSPGGLLASQCLRRQGSFSITESFLQEPPKDAAWTAWSAPGFSSYRVTEPDVMHMHCSGLSLQEGGRLFNLDTTQDWIPIPQQVCRRDTVTGQPDNWVESVGYAVTASALGVDSISESCSARAFVHQSPHHEQRQPMARFVSFVMDM